MQNHQIEKGGAFLKTGGVRFDADAVGAFKILKTHRRNWIVYAGSGEYNTINQKNYKY